MTPGLPPAGAAGQMPRGSYAVMAQRQDRTEGLDFFPTPPWATRALCRHILEPWLTTSTSAWDPAAGEGHMAEVLREFFAQVDASDIFNYSRGYRAADFLSANTDAPVVDWIITNPPFKAAEQFAARALTLASTGVAFLVRSAWLEGTGRHDRLFRPQPPAVVAQFAERVPMTKGRWDPAASTATSYSWVVWVRGVTNTRFDWIPPGQRTALTLRDDVARFAEPAHDNTTEVA